MNPLATPENIKAAEEAVKDQTAATVADIEAARLRNSPQRAAIHADLVERTFQEIEAARNRPPPILSGKLVLKESTDADKKTGRRMITLAGEEGGAPPVVLEVYTNDPRFTDAAKGAGFDFELRPVVAAAKPVPGSTDGRAGMGRGPELEPGELPEVTKEIPREVPAITGDIDDLAADLELDQPAR